MKVLSLFLCAGLLTASLESLHHTFLDDDAGCAIAVERHDADAHRFGAGDDGRPLPAHCFICHWARAFRIGPQRSAHVAAPPLGTAVAHVDPTPPPVAAAVFSQLPARAPPHTT